MILIGVLARGDDLIPSGLKTLHEVKVLRWAQIVVVFRRRRAQLALLCCRYRIILSARPLGVELGVTTPADPRLAAAGHKTCGRPGIEISGPACDCLVSAIGFREAHDVHVFSLTKNNEFGRCSWLRYATDAM
jgi:hypothetical protein